MTSRLSPDHQQIQDRFLDNLAEGGFVAAQNMVAGYAVEAAAAKVLSYTTKIMESTNEDLSQLLPTSDLAYGSKVVEFVEAVERDNDLATRHYIFALDMLNSVNKHTQS